MAVVIAAMNLAPAASQVTKPKESSQVSTEEQEAAWQRLRSMVGVWKGVGEPGHSRVEQGYELILQDKFLHVRTKSITETDTHEDWEILSYDSIRRKVVLRQFVSEGFINRFLLDQLRNDGRTLVFVSEACENAPSGFRARQTLTFESDNRISQELELAPPGRKFSRCAASTMTRDR